MKNLREAKGWPLDHEHDCATARALLWLNNKTHPLGRLRDVYQAFRSLSGYRSQIGQDSFVDRYFSRERGLTFLEAGAHDGVHLSNTYFLEMTRGWTGCCIEPSPQTFPSLVQNRQSASCTCLNIALDSTEGEASYTMARELGGLTHRFHPRHLSRVLSISGGEVTTRTKTLAEVLKFLGMAKISYLSLDTEGSELDILQGVGDWDRFLFDLIGVENNYGNSVGQFLQQRGYRYVTTRGLDEFYEHK